MFCLIQSGFRAFAFGRVHFCYHLILHLSDCCVQFCRSAGRTTVTLSFNCQFHYNGQKVEKEFKPSGTIWVVPDPPLALGMGATWVLPPSYISSSLLPQLKNPVPGFSDPGRSGGSVVYSVMQVSDHNNRSSRFPIYIHVLITTG